MRLIWSKNPFSFPFPPLEKNEPSKQRAKCVRLSGTIIATVLSSLPYVPFLLAFQQLLSYQNFAASRKGWWESAKTRWWNQPWCDGSWWFLSLRGSLANCFHSTRVAPSSHNRRSNASFQEQREKLRSYHTIWICINSLLFEFSRQNIFVWLSKTVDFLFNARSLNF